MANARTHQVVGVISGLGVTALCRIREEKNVRLGELLGAGFGGAVGGALPDLIEPATSSYHRQFAHSGVAAGGIVFTALKGLPALRAKLDAKADELYAQATAATHWLGEILLFLGAFLIDALAGFVTGVAGGYLSHILLDATTPRGVPII